MKPNILCVLTATALSVATAGVPLRWTVETSRLSPVTFDAVRGETLALEATFMSYGKPLSMAGKDAFIFWQTNGMASTYWQSPASVRGDAAPGVVTNVIAATFTPAMYPGASTVTGFLGTTGDIYRAAFTLRFRNGPGAVPNALPLPTPTIDCATTTFLHPESAPFSGGGGGGVNTNAVRDLIAPATNATLQAAKADAAAKYLPTSGGTVYNYVAVADEGSESCKVMIINGSSDGPSIWLTDRDEENPLLLYNRYIILEGDDIPQSVSIEFPLKNGTFALTDDIPTVDYSTNNTTLVSTITNLAPTRARGLVLHDPTRNCNWYPAVTNGVFYWLIED